MAEMNAADKKRIDTITARFAEMKAARLPYEPTWQQIAEYIMPRRDFTLTQEPNALRARKLVDTTAAVANERLAAMLHGYMMSPAQPWIRPTLAGDTPSREEGLWFEDAQYRMHEFLSGARSSFRANIHEVLLDMTSIGSGVLWMGDTGRGTRPFFKAMPLKECWWDENERGEVDTLYREFTRTLRRALELYPDAPGLKAKAETEKNNLEQLVTFIHAVEPRPGGKRGAVSTNLPWASTVYCSTTNEIAAEKGFEGFPYAVARMMRHTGEVYGRGMGWNALPLAKLLNAIGETIIRQAELAAEPPLIDITGELAKLDRRAGAVNPVNVSELNMMGLDVNKLVYPIHEGGDASLAVGLVQEYRRQVELMFFVDWMSLRENAQMTATEVNERRDVRLRSMSPIVARGEQELLSRVADRTFELMSRAGMFEPAPPSLARRDIDFEYTSPLAMAQRQSELETAMTVMALVERGMVFRPDVVDNFDFDTMLRDAVEATGSPLRHTRAEKAVVQLREIRRQREEQDIAIERTAQLGAAARDGGQAIASLMQAQQAQAA